MVVEQVQTTMLGSWYEVFLPICCVWVSPDMVLCIMIKDLHFDVVCPKDIIPKVVQFCLGVNFQILVVQSCSFQREEAFS